jgi:hypothetical protein
MMGPRQVEQGALFYKSVPALSNQPERVLPGGRPSWVGSRAID